MNSMWVLRTLARRWVGDRAARDNSPRRSRRRRAVPRAVRLAVEALEDRTLLSVLPAPITTGHIDVSNPTGYSGSGPQDNENTPSIAYDPVTPTNLVSVYTRSITGQSRSEIDIATSTDGGQTWSAVGGITQNSVGNTIVQTLPDPTNFSSPQLHYAYATNASVAFDRAHNYYVSFLESQGPDLAGITASGALVVHRYSFGSSSPTATSTIYQWVGQDPALNPRLTVDSNLPSYTDPVTLKKVTDPFANPTTSSSTGAAADPDQDHVYVTWNTANTAPTSFGLSPFNPNTIKVAASSDGGITFTTQVLVNTSGNTSTGHDSLPVPVVAQGTLPGTANFVPGGQVAIAWNDFANRKIVANTVSDGGTGFSPNLPVIPQGAVYEDGTSAPAGGTHIYDAKPAPGNNQPHVAATTSFILDLSGQTAPAGFTTVSDLQVSLAVAHAHLNELNIVLTAPNNRSVTLLVNKTDHSGNNSTDGVPDAANIGLITGGNPVVTHEVDTLFSDAAPRPINDGSAKAPYTAIFEPDDGTSLDFLISGSSFSSIAGVWTLTITDTRNDGSKADGTNQPSQDLVHWGLTFTSHLTPNADHTAASGVTFPDSNATLGAPMAPFPLLVPSDPSRGVSPAPSLAVDNTLGSFSPFQGRLYLAYTGPSSYVPPGLTKPLHTDTNIYLVTSDDGGVTWSTPTQVNDDAPTDNFSEGDRTQYEPSVAVDPVTGTLAISFYDARNDPGIARVATYLATSVDGGSTFAPETYLNSPQQTLDASQFNGDPTTSGSVAVTLGPIPDNQSVTNSNADSTFAFGDHQGLTIYDGQVHAAWSGNENGGPRLTSLDGTGTLFTTNLLDILTSTTVITTGPRVFGQTDGGPVQFGAVESDGTVVPTGFNVTFDRPVDIASFKNHAQTLVNVVFRSPTTAATNSAPYFGGTLLDPTKYTVTPLDAGGPFGPAGVGRFGGTNYLATEFHIGFAIQAAPGYPAITDPVGTYSYSIGDLFGTGTTVHDDIRPPDVTSTAPGNNMDQNGNAVTDEADVDVYANPRPLGGTPFSLPYDGTTLPLIVPGPHIISRSVPGQPNSVVLNTPSPASAIDVVFDRNMDMSSFTTAQLLRLQGPVGIIPLFDSMGAPLPGVGIIPDPNTTDPDPAHPRTFRITLPTGVYLQQDGSISTNVTPWNILTINGSYTLTLGAGIRSAAGDAVDNNENAGVAVTDGIDPDTSVTASTTLTAAVTPSQTTIHVASAAGFPTTGQYVIGIDSEQLLVTGGQGTTTWAVTRGFNNTTAAMHAQNATVVGLATIGISNSSNTTVSIGPNSTAKGFITFPQGFQIEHAQVLLNITSPDSRDLEGFLISPSGNVVVKLFTNPGAAPNTGKQTGFINTVLDDLGPTPIQPSASGTSPAQPLTGTFNPQQPLSTLNNTSSAGTWTLLLQNDSSTHTDVLTNWKLTFAETQLGTGLGEPVADQSNVSFRIFNMGENAALPLSTWTPVGPAAEGGNSGRIGGIAVDPSDPSGNTVYVAGATGGVWKTTNFLNTRGDPTWIPLTDFGPNSGINIGGIAVFGRNNDPNQSIVYAVTGDGDGGAGEGVGVLRSTDGGAHWDLLDSLVNVYNSSNDGGNSALDGTLLPLSMRDHALVGPTAFKIIVDPVLNPSTNQPVLFFASSGGNGGIYRSLDGGNTWQNVLPGNATDVALAPYSAFDPNNPAAPPGNAQIVYAAFSTGGTTTEGVYKSSTEGALGTWSLMAGQLGGNPLLQVLVKGLPKATSAAIPSKLPQQGSSRIVLSVPALTGALVPGKPYSGGHPLQDLIQENWVYAAVVGSSSGSAEGGGGGKLFGLFLTKDGGNNWTQVHFPYSVDETNPAIPPGNPTNNDQKTDFEPFAGGLFSGGQGSYDISLQVDPNNANVVYLGGTADGPPWALSRIDTTGIGDPYALVGYDNNDNDTGMLAFPSTGRAMPPAGKSEPNDGFAAFPNLNGVPYINLLRNPSDPFAADATIIVAGVPDKSAGTAFTNEGSDIATWGPFGGSGGTDHHRVVAFRDPTTGKTRLIFGDDQGVWTSVDDGSGNVLSNLNNGEVQLAGLDRNGNLQIAQIYYSAAQPSDLANQIGGALFYANLQDDGFPQSDPGLLADGNIAWSGGDGDGTGIATDQTGSGTVYTYRWPCCGGGGVTGSGGTDFFEVNSTSTGGYVSRTNGLIIQNNPGSTPDPEWPFVGGFNFAVNPSNGDDILISSGSGNLFRTGDQGNDWVVIGGPATSPDQLDATNTPGMAFGPVDPKDASARPDLDNLYAGGASGDLFVTLDGGGHWVNAGTATSTALAGRVQSISPNPRPGTHEAYVVTTAGTYHLTYGVTYSAQGVPSITAGSIVLTQINGSGANSLFALPHVGFANSPLYTEPFLKDPAGNVLGLTALAVDWRYAIPDNPANPTGTTHPILYVGGVEGIFRSEDGGKNWTPFPDDIATNATAADGSIGDGAPVNGGLFPLARVSDLHLVLGDVNPQTGLPDQSQGPNLLFASTYGRGAFAIRLPLAAPYDVEQTLHVVSAVPTNAGTTNPNVTPLPNPVNPQVGLDRITVTFNGTVDPATFLLSDVTLSGPNGVISGVGLRDVTVATSNGNPHNVWEIDFPHQSVIGTYTLHIDPTLQDLAGRFMDQDADDNVVAQDALDTRGTADVGDGFTGTFLIQGLQVTAANPVSGTIDTPPGLSVITVTFNAPVDPASFTAANISVMGPPGAPGPNGPIAGATFKDVTPIGAAEPHSIWEIDLPGAKTTYPGTYTIVIGPGIKDTGDGTGSGNAAEEPMDQDEDSTSPPAATIDAPGSADDAYTLTYTVPSLFVTAVTPDPTKPVLVPSQQAGATGLQTITLTFSRDVKASTLVPANFTLTGPATSTGPGPAITIPAGAISSSTPAGQPANSLVQISLPSAILTPGVYTLTVGTGVEDQNSVPLDQETDPATDAPGTTADDAFTTQFSVVGLQVVSITPAAPPPPTFAGQTGVTFTFNQAVKAGTIDGSVMVLDPKGNPVAVGTAVDANPGTDTQWTVPFQTPQFTYGTYTVTIGPYQTTDSMGHLIYHAGPADIAGHAMNQNNNSAFGELGVSPAGDDYTNSFTLAGLMVTAVTPMQAASQPILEPVPGLQTFTVTFNQSINAGTFIPANLTLTGPETPAGPGATIAIPAGDISNITPAGKPANSVFQIRLTSALTTPGIYTLTVGTGVEDAGNNPLDQNQDHFAVTSPDAGDPDAQDAYVAQFDVDGLAVKTVVVTGTADPSAPAGQLFPGVTTATLTFNQPVLPASITNVTPGSASVVLTDPTGASVALTSIAPAPGDTTGEVWQVTFPGQTIPGVYKLTVGPGVEDLAGNKMNQNHNLVYGEAGDQSAKPSAGDAFSSTFAITGLRVLSITPTLTVPVLEPTGLGSTDNPITVTFNREVDPASFTQASGGNAVNLALKGPQTPSGPGAAVPIPVTGLADVTPMGATFAHSVWQITLASPAVIPGIYALTVGPNITDGDPVHRKMDQNGNFNFGQPGDQSAAPPGDAFTARFDVDGLKVTNVVVAGTPDPFVSSQLLPGVTTATVSFNQPVLPSSIGNNSFKLIDPNNNIVSVTNVSPVAGDTTGEQWQVTFPGQKVPGVYHLTVLHGIKDLAGNQMNQNHNAVFGESGDQNAAPPGDDFTTTFAVAGLKVKSVELGSSTTPTLSAPVPVPPGLGASSPAADVITVTFNREVLPASFTQADNNGNAVNLVLTGPETETEPGDVVGPGAVIPIPVSGLVDVTPAGAFAHSVWQITLATSVTTSGIYTLTVGPAVTDSTGHQMDQEGDLIFPPTDNDPTDDRFTTQFDVAGLRVTQVTPSGPTQLPPGVSEATVTFNQPVLHSSLTGANVALTDPTGASVTLTGFVPDPSDATGKTWDVQFAGQTIPGVYKLTVGPGVEDLAGNAMNQNQNGTFGDAGDQFASPQGDAFSSTFAVVGLKVLSVTPSLTTPVLAPGLGASAPTPITVTFNREVGSFQPGDVVLTAPDGTTVPSSAITPLDKAVGSGDNVWEVDVNPPLTTPGIYTLTLGPNIADGDPTHARMDQNGNLVFGESSDTFTTQFDVAGLAVTQVQYTGTPDEIAPSQLLPGVGSATISFNEAVLASTITNVDSTKGAVNVTLTDPTGKPVTLSGIAAVAGDTTGTLWQVTFPGQTIPGVYKLTVGPGVEDTAGNKMNQNQNGTFGDAGDQNASPPGDAFTSTFAVAGLKVVTVTPSSVQAPPGLSTIDVVFNRDVNPKTFTPAQLVLTRPDGSTVTGLAVKDLAKTTDHHIWEVDLPGAESEAGSYMLTISQNVADGDPTGAKMDQNGNFKFGESSDAVTAFLSVTTPASQVAAALNNPLTGPVDVSGFVTILVSPPVRRHGHGHFMQQVTIFNNTGFPIQGPFSLILVGLPRKAHLLNASGLSLTRAPRSPFQLLFFPNAVLDSFAGGTFTLLFSATSAKQIKYVPLLLVGNGII